MDLNNKFFAWDLNRYLRVGNGNQLVRDPTTISRALASDKVRWSLQTTRCRLAKNNIISNFLQDLENAIRREVNVLTFMIEKRYIYTLIS